MDQPTLEYLSKNLTEFAASVLVGAGIGYANSRSRSEDKLVDKPELSKLGFATLLSFVKDPVTMGLAHLGMGSDTSIMKVAQGDIGDIVGWYVGFYVGKAIDKGLSRVYRSRD